MRFGAAGRRRQAASIISANCNYGGSAHAGRRRIGAKHVANGLRRRFAVRMHVWIDRRLNEEISRPDCIDTGCRNKLRRASHRASAGEEATFNYRTLRDNVPSVGGHEQMTLQLAGRAAVGLIWRASPTDRAASDKSLTSFNTVMTTLSCNAAATQV